MQKKLNGRVIATFGRHLIVREAGGRELRARPFGRDLVVVCGDEVRYRIDPHHEEVHVVELLPRRTVLYRAAARGGAEPLIANLTELLVVLAPLPVPDLFVVDRYLAAARSARLAATLIVNKSELGIGRALETELASYASSDYQIVRCSAKTREGLAAFRAALPRSAVAALVGQSGVGKSSLVRRLLPEAEVEIGALARAQEGRHTTSAARLFALPEGAELIDSPGVRDFTPAAAALEERTLGFIEVQRLAPACRFLDCRHMQEPDCAVRAAAEAGTINPRRYESYRRLRRLRDEQARSVRGTRER